MAPAGTGTAAIRRIRSAPTARWAAVGSCRLTQARPWPQAAQQERPVVRVGAEQLDRPRTGPGSERGGLVACLEVRVRELEDDVVACRRRGRGRPRRHARVEGLTDDEAPALRRARHRAGIESSHAGPPSPPTTASRRPAGTVTVMAASCPVDTVPPPRAAARAPRRGRRETRGSRIAGGRRRSATPSADRVPRWWKRRAGFAGGSPSEVRNVCIQRPDKSIQSRAWSRRPT